MLDALLLDSEKRTLADIAGDLGIPVSTAHRYVATLCTERLVVHSKRGRYHVGPRLLRLAARSDDSTLVVNVAGPLLQDLAGRARCVVQLGTFDDEMITYRLKFGNNASKLFTEVGGQQEAYCTAIGKVLLANLGPAEIDQYLAVDAFPALTANTITDPAALRLELGQVHEQGFAIDAEETAVRLRCLALPIRNAQSAVVAALSASRYIGGKSHTLNDAGLLALLSTTVRAIEDHAFG